MLRKWLLTGLCIVFIFSCACCAKRTEQGAWNDSIPDEVVSLVSVTESSDDSSYPDMPSSEALDSVVSEASSVPSTGAPASEASSSLREPSIAPPPEMSSDWVNSSFQESSQTVRWNSSPDSSEPGAVLPSSSVTTSSGQITVTLSICGVEGAVICRAQSLTVPENSTVFTVLRDYARQTGLEFSYTGGAKSAYVTGIEGLYEFDYGNQSGWLYRVNGDFAAASVSCGSYPVHEGDQIEWLYTTDRGADVGAPRF